MARRKTEDVPLVTEPMEWVSLQVEADLKRWARVYAAKHGISLSALVRKLLHQERLRE